MGYDTTRFVSPVDEELLCSICLGVLEDPVHGTCGHTFCKICINNWLQSQNTCPMCKTTQSRGDLVSVGIINFKNLINRLKVKCDHQPSGCDVICQLSDLPDHLKICQLRPDAEIKCDLGCDLKMLRKTKEDHKCLEALKVALFKKDGQISDLTETLNDQCAEIASLKNKLTRLEASNPRYHQTNAQQSYRRPARWT